MSDFIVGLTGGIGSGKTTVSDMFESYGIDVIDADVIAREVVAPNSHGLGEVVNAFGKDVLLDNGELNRAALRVLVFNDEQAKQTLNNILHPIIRKQILNQLANARSTYCMLSAPLLFENNLHKLCNKSVVVDVSESVQIQRTCERDSSDATTIKNIIKAQISREERLRLADYVVDNSGDLTQLPAQVAKLHECFLALAKK